MTRAGLAVLVAVLVMAPVAVRLARREAPPAAIEGARRFILPARCLPEPGERAAYVACAVGLPALIFAVSWVGRRRTGPTLPGWADDLASLGLMGLALAVTVVGARREGTSFLDLHGFARASWWSIPPLGATLALLRWGRRGGRTFRVVAHVLAGTAIVAMAAARVFGASADYAYEPHFEPLYYAAVQVALGKTILVDMASQYGLYPHALAPVLAATGLSVTAFTLVMAALVAAVFAAVWGFLCGATENRAVALVGFLAFVANGSLMLLRPGPYDPYFQYLPIRVVFPAASVWLSWRYLLSPTRRSYWLTTAVLALGPLWNLDSGVPALAAWLGMLGYRELAEPGRSPLRRLARIAGHVGIGAGAVALAGLAYTGWALARSGRPPDYASFVSYQAMFYASGFFMLPMPALGGWSGVALVYLAGLASAARDVAEGRAGPRSAMLFQLAALGIGLFSYYQGRSHPMVLTQAWWPAGLLLTLFLDGLLADRGRTRARAARLAWAAALAWILGGSAWTFARSPGLLGERYGRHLLASGTSRAAADVERIRATVRPDDRLLIVSLNESHLDAALRTPSAWRCSLVESILVDDFRALAERVGRGEFDWVFVDESLAAPHLRDNLGLAELSGVIDGGTVVASTPRGRLIRPGASAPPLLGSGPARLHVRYADGRAEGKLSARPMTLGPRFTIEAILKPEASQPPFATILGNHPGIGANGAAGFAIQQHGPDPAVYCLFAGDGRAFLPVAGFRLEPGRWNYLAIAVGGGKGTSYVDGRPVLTWPVPEPLAVAESLLPVVVGDWRDRDRPFRGRIAEVRIADEAASPEDVARRWSDLGAASRAFAALDEGVRR